jgi:hypothetical protein
MPAWDGVVWLFPSLAGVSEAPGRRVKRMVAGRERIAPVALEDMFGTGNSGLSGSN